MKPNNIFFEFYNLILVFFIFFLVQKPSPSWTVVNSINQDNFIDNKMINQEIKNKKEVAIFAGGCFWCTEAVFQKLNGVLEVIPGYTGGQTQSPSYEQVCSGTTGHAEAIKIIFDPKVISYTDLLDVFWEVHNPTEFNRQGNDVGTQYRSEIFYLSERQKEEAELSKGSLEKNGVYDKTVVTRISKASEFYPAEKYHYDYYNNNKEQSYCRYVISPKVLKFQKSFSKKLKK